MTMPTSRPVLELTAYSGGRQTLTAACPTDGCLGHAKVVTLFLPKQQATEEGPWAAVTWRLDAGEMLVCRECGERFELLAMMLGKREG